MNYLINHSDPFKKTRLLAVLLVVLLLPQGMWADSKTYTFTGSTKTLNTTTATYDMNFYSAEEEEDSTWVLSGATYGNGLGFGVSSSSTGTGFTGATLTSVDEFHMVSKIIFNVDLSEEAIEYVNTRWVKFRCNQTEIEFDMNTLNMNPDEEGVALEMNYWPYGPLTVYIEGYGYEITLNSITVEYERASWHDNSPLTYYESWYGIDWSLRDTADFPLLGYFDPNWESNEFFPLGEDERSLVNFSSSDESVATIDDYGMITILNPGSTTINANFPGNTRYEGDEASFDLIVYEEYDLWIGDTQVTGSNCKDILGDGDATQDKAASFQYFPKLHKLFITNNTDGLKIVTNDDRRLTIYLAPNSNNTVGGIDYGGKGDAPLTITTDGNYPGHMTLSANSDVISGFSSLTLEQNLVVMDPEGIAYNENSRELTATSATIGAPLSPITEGKAIVPDGSQLEPEPGNSDINKVVDDILYTLGNTDNSNGDGYDDEGGYIVINSVTSDQQAAYVTQEYTPRTDEYLNGFKGMTFMVPAGSGNLKFNAQSSDGHALKVMIGDAMPVVVEDASQEIPYNVAEPTFVYAYNGGKTGDANSARGIQRGKKTTVHIKIYSISITPTKVKQSNSAAQASDGGYQGGSEISGLNGQGIESEEEIEGSKGDVDGNESINSDDIIEMVNDMMGKHSSVFDSRAADLNGDGCVNVADLVQIVKKIFKP